jgi:hypothetical protein
MFSGMTQCIDYRMMTNFVRQMHFLPIWDTWFSKFSGGVWPQIPLVVPVFAFVNLAPGSDTWGVKKYLWFRFTTDPIFFCRPYYFFNAIDPIFSGWLRATAKMASVVTQLLYWKTMKKIFKKKFISDLPTLIFSRYETGTVRLCNLLL